MNINMQILHLIDWSVATNERREQETAPGGRYSCRRRMFNSCGTGAAETGEERVAVGSCGDYKEWVLYFL